MQEVHPPICPTALDPGTRFLGDPRTDEVNQVSQAGGATKAAPEEAGKGFLVPSTGTQGMNLGSCIG